MLFLGEMIYQRGRIISNIVYIKGYIIDLIGSMACQTKVVGHWSVVRVRSICHWSSSVCAGHWLYTALVTDKSGTTNDTVLLALRQLIRAGGTQPGHFRPSR